MPRQTKRFYFILVIALLVVGGALFGLLHGVSAQQQTPDLGLQPVGPALGLPSTDLRLVIARIIRVALGILGILAVVLIIYAGVVWMTAGGDEEKIATAKKIITNGVIGLVIIMSSYAIATFVIDKLVGAVTGTQGQGGGGAGGGSNGSLADLFYIQTLPASGQMCVSNVHPTIVFNRPVAISSLNGTVVLMAANGSAVPGSWGLGIKDSVAVFTPQGACPSGTGQDCLAANGQYTVHFVKNSNGQIPIYSQDTSTTLNCALGAGCTDVSFTAGSGVDTVPPTVHITTYPPLVAGTSVPVKLDFTDDQGVSNVALFNGDNAIASQTLAGCQKSGSVTLNWPTDNLAAGPYTLDAVATDQAANTGTDSENVNLISSQCINPNGTLVCGSGCGACAGSTCSTNSDCASGSCINGVCAATMMIRWVDPLSGAPGTYVTISGQYFGTVPGHVYFAGKPNPSVTSTSDWVEAPLVRCTAASSWTATQLVVEVPNGAANGPIMVVTAPTNTASSSIDTTNDANGPVLNDFQITSQVRPGLCAITPDSGPTGASVVLSGTHFGPTGGNANVLFGNLFASIAQTSWSDSAIQTVVPALATGVLGVHVQDASGVPSNGVRFSVLTATQANGPLIESITPERGPAGQYVTITGKNFGTSLGQVWFKLNGTGQIVDPTHEFDFPAACQNAVWTDSQIIVKVPDGVKSTLGRYSVQVYPPGGQPSPIGQAWFTVVDGVPAPGICKIDPTAGPVPLASGQAIKLTGEYFTAAATGGEVLGYSFDKDNTSGTTVTDESGSGNNGTLQNGVAFDTGKTGEGLHFAGDSSYVSVSNFNPFSPAYSFSAWLNPDDYNNRALLIGSNSCLEYFELHGGHTDSLDGHVMVYHGVTPYTSIVSNGTVPLHAWTHVAVTWDGATIKTYINGVLDNSVKGTIQPSGGSRNGRISNGCQVGTYPYHGYLDDVKIFSRALSANEVAALYSGSPLAQNSSNAYFWATGASSTSLVGRLGANQTDLFTLAATQMTARPPAGTITGPVVVYRASDSQLSNPVSFAVQDCTKVTNACGTGYQCCSAGPDTGLCRPANELCAGQTRSSGYLWRFSTGTLPPTPHVVESCNDTPTVAESLPSPSPSIQWNTSTNNDASNVCLQALPTIEFTTPIDASTVNASSVYIQTCADVQGTTCVSPSTEHIDLDPGSYTVEPSTNGRSFIQLSLPNNTALADNQWYQVVLQNSIASVGGAGSSVNLAADKPCGGNSAYCFVFKTGTQNCKLKTVIVTPYSWVTNLLESPMLQHLNGSVDPLYYVGNGLSDQRCILMNVGDYNWSWNVANKNNTTYAQMYQGKNTGQKVQVSSVANTVGVNLTNPNDAVNVQATAATGTLSYQGVSPLRIDLSTPQVVDYWPSCQAACTNAEVGVRFNVALSTRNLLPVAAANPAVQLLRCLDENCQTTTPVQTPVSISLDLDSNNQPAQIHLANLGLLDPNTLYEVTLSASTTDLTNTQLIWSRASIQSPDSYSKPMEGIFSWKFKTKDGPCAVNRVDVQPAVYNAQFFDDKTVFHSDAYSSPDSCDKSGQKIDPWTLDWSWSSSDTNVATITSFVTKGANQYCTASCTRKGSALSSSSNQPVAVCGNGAVEAGEDCDSPNKQNGCGLDCRYLGNPDPTTCGDGIVEHNLGEACDPADPATKVGCSSDCRHLGSSPTASSQNVSASLCGNGLIGSGEDCDLGVSPAVNVATSSLNCTAQCLHTGTQLTTAWCSDHASDYGGFTFAEYQKACAQALSKCGDGITSPEEDPGCDLGNGKHAAWCNEYCLVNALPPASVTPPCTPNTPGCDKNGQYMGSSILYTTPSVCGDGVAGTGEVPVCETNLLYNSSTTLHTIGDPWSLAAGVGLGTASGNPPAQVATITAAPASTQASGSGKFVIGCGFKTDADCQARAADPTKQYGVGADTCCYERTKLVKTWPLNQATSVCPNTTIEATFSAKIDPTSVSNTIIVARKVTPDTTQTLHQGAVADPSLNGVTGVAPYGSYVVATAGTANDVSVVDVSNPKAPQIAGTFTSTDPNGMKNPYGVAISGQYAFVTSYGDGFGNNSGIEVLNLSNPKQPAHVTFSTGIGYGANLSGISISGNRAYVTSEGYAAMSIVNISDPTHLTKVSTITANSDQTMKLHQPDAVLTVGTVAYVASRTDNALAIIDISNETAPQYLGYIDNSTDSRIAMQQPAALAYSNGYLYVAAAGANAVEVLSLQDPKHPTHAGVIHDGDGGALLNAPHSIAIIGSYAFVASKGSNAVEILDISDPTHPAHVDSMVDQQNGALLAGADAITASSTMVYAGANAGQALEVIDSSLYTGSGPNIDCGSSADVTALIAANLPPNVAQPEPWYWHVYHTAIAFFKRLFGSDAVAAPQLYKWCAEKVIATPQIVDDTSATGSHVILQLRQPLAKMSDYAVVLSNGIRDTRGVSIGTNSDGSAIHWQFSTANVPICELKSVTVLPKSAYFSLAFATTTLEARAFTQTGIPIQPIPNVYSWQYLWGPMNNPFVSIDTSTDATRPVLGSKNQNGETDVVAQAVLTTNLTSANSGKTGIVATGRMHSTVYICENPWPPQHQVINNTVETVFPYEDTLQNNDNYNLTTHQFDGTPIPPADQGGYFNFRTYYCADNGSHGTFDDLPYLEPAVQTSAAVLSPTHGTCELSGDTCSVDADCGELIKLSGNNAIVPLQTQSVCGATTSTDPNPRFYIGTDGKAVSCSSDSNCTGNSSVTQWSDGFGSTPSCLSPTITPRALTCYMTPALKRFLFTASTTADAIGIQVFPNPRTQTIDDWYAQEKSAGGQGFAGASQHLQVDGYDAISDGDNIYVDAVNYSGTAHQWYSNIYLFSINSDATPEMRNVFEQIVKNLHFNSNLTNDGYCKQANGTLDYTTACNIDFDCPTGETCSDQIAKLKRNYRRLRDFKIVEQALESYASNHNGAYPTLSAGTYLKGQSISTWPSWGDFGNQVGIAVPTDPINQLGKAGTCSLSTDVFCTQDSDCAAATPAGQTCVLHDPSTGWSTVDRRFSFACATTSLAYRYSIAAATGYTFRAHLEDTGIPLSTTNGFFSNYVDPNKFIYTAESGICNQDQEITTLNQGTCGDGVVNADKGETCDPPGQSRYGNCINGRIQVDVCGSSCTWVASSTPSGDGTVSCSYLSKCGDGIVETGEVCDDGALNGRYNHCNSNCLGWGGAGYCGDRTLEQGKELCDATVNLTSTQIGWCITGKNIGKACANDTDCNSLTVGACSNALVSKIKYASTQDQSCNFDCQSHGPYCGDGIVQSAYGEECDGNVTTDANGAPLTVGGTPCTKVCNSCRIGDSQAGAWWRFNDAYGMSTSTGPSATIISMRGNPGGIFPDATNNHNDAQCFGSVCPGLDSQGHSGSAAYFNGTSNFLGVLDKSSIMPSNAITVEAWVKPTSYTTKWQRVVEKGGFGFGGGYTMQFWNEPDNSGAKINFVVYGNDTYTATAANGTTSQLYKSFLASSKSDIPLNTWTHIVGTFERDGTSNVIRIYINGVDDTGDIFVDGDQASSNVMVTSSVYLASTSAPLIIGRGSQVNSYFYSGSIDELRIYPRAIASAEVQDHYANTWVCAPQSPITQVAQASGPRCGDGHVDQGEACDNGDLLNGKACTPTYGASCTYCSADCKNVIDVQPTQYCGDGVVETTKEKCDTDISGQSPVIYAAATSTGTSQAFDPTHKGYQVLSCSQEPQDPNSLKKGVKSCVNSCSAVQVTAQGVASASCTKCGIDNDSGVTVQGTIVNVLDPNSNNPLYVNSQALTNYKTSQQTSDNGQVQLVIPATSDNGEVSVAQTFLYAIPTTAPVNYYLKDPTVDPVTGTQKALISSATICSYSDPSYELRVNNDDYGAHEIPLPVHPQSGPGDYDLLLSPVISSGGLFDPNSTTVPPATITNSVRPNDIRIVVSWTGDAALSAGIIYPDPSSTNNTVEDGSLVPSEVTGYTYFNTQPQPNLGIWYHGSTATPQQTNVEAFTIDTSQMATSSYFFYVRSSDLSTPILNWNQNNVRVDVYIPENDPIYYQFSRPYKTYYLNNVTVDANGNAQAPYWHVFTLRSLNAVNDVASRIENVYITNYPTSPDQSATIITYPYGRLVTAASDFK